MSVMNSGLKILLAQKPSIKRLYNYSLAKLGYLLSNICKKALVWGAPPVVKIEPTTCCNLKCPLCHTTRGILKRGKGFIDYNLYTNIIDSLQKKTMMITLAHMGEPFLHKDIYKMITYARKQGYIVTGITNMNFPLDAEMLIKTGLSKLNVSVDGLTQKTYEKYRVGGDLQLALNNIKKLAQAKKKLRTSMPLISFRYMYFAHNSHEEIEQVEKLAKEYGANEIKIVKPFIIDKNDTKYLNKQHSNYKVDEDGCFHLNYDIPNKCSSIWHELVVDYNGEVEICCFDKLSTIIGDVKKESPLKIWKKENIQSFRQKILNNRKSIKACSICFNDAGVWEHKKNL